MTHHPRRSGPVPSLAIPGIWALTILTIMARTTHALAALSDDRESERGDVPGWVLVTLMTAGLVTMLWALAGAQLSSVFTNAISSVTGAK
jgi:mannose/fructose/N-acetylgalactosamine-specific phosphotransferase system component IIC